MASNCGQGLANIFFMLYVNILNSRLSRVAFLPLVFSFLTISPLRNGPWKLSVEDPTCDLSLCTVLTKTNAGKEKGADAHRHPMSSSVCSGYEQDVVPHSLQLFQSYFNTGL